MSDTLRPEDHEPTQAAIDAADWLSRLLDNPSDAVMQECKAWLDRVAGHQSAFASAMFATPMSDDVRFRIEEGLGRKFPSLHAPATQARPSAVVTPITVARQARERRRVAAASPSRSRWRSIAGPGAVVAAAVGLTLTFAPQLLPFALFSAAHAETLETGHGVIRSFTLADGSSVTLDADSRVIVTIDQARRHVSLRQGRARFIVKQNPRPFTIDAGKGEIQSTNGTIDVAIEEKEHGRCPPALWFRNNA